jgi:hypothetical protein
MKEGLFFYDIPKARLFGVWLPKRFFLVIAQKNDEQRTRFIKPRKIDAFRKH